MIRIETPLSRILARTLAVTIANLALPFGFAGLIHDPLHPELPVAPKPVAAPSRLLSAKEQKQMSGKDGQNPYIAGTTKFAVSLHGVDLLTRNFTTSVTDLDFQGGYGIPVSIVRSYSANNPDDGPLGPGWTLSVDLRTSAGGVIKSKSAPTRMVPVLAHERPTTEVDPNIPAQPVEGVTQADASGKDETIQRDVDGILSAPAWDQNKYDNTYDVVNSSGTQTATLGATFKVMTGQTVTTPEGTVYVYSAHGSYTAGLTSITNTSAPVEPSNILKIDSATDRQGNVTSYHYLTTNATYAKSNGSVLENELSYISMPNSHRLNFTYTGNYITTIDDKWTTSPASYRAVGYTYDTTSHTLKTVTSPAGLVTHYTYTSPVTGNINGPGGLAENLLTTITDPRGLVRTIEYQNSWAYALPYMAATYAADVSRVTEPNGVQFLICGNADGLIGVDSDWPSDMGDGNMGAFWIQYREYAGAVADANLTAKGYVGMALDSIDHTFTATFFDQNVFVKPYSTSTLVYPGFPHVIRTFDAMTQNMLDEMVLNNPYANPHGYTYPDGHAIAVAGETNTGVETISSYNLFGKPLKKEVKEYDFPGYVLQRDTSTDTAYWKSDKYYQQKATQTQIGVDTYSNPVYRYTFTDYYPNTASAGSKGQTAYTYDPKFGVFALDSGLGPTWRYQIHVPSDNSSYSGKIVYDTQGRATDIWKIHSGTAGTPSTYGYVQTHTVYGASDHTFWGEPSQVVEDYGTGKINRTTTTGAYDLYGRATDVTDAAGHEFVTSYDADGKIQSITRTDGTPQTIATYTYGALPTYPVTSVHADAGQITSVTDGLSGTSTTLIKDQIEYAGSGGGVGQPSDVKEYVGTTLNYQVNYDYDAYGDRKTAEYVTANGNNKWLYDDYITVGTADSFKRVFQTFCKLDDSTGNHTPEEMHYDYDSAGRLRAACFAQTPSSGYSPSSGATYYPPDYNLDGSTKLAASRARAYYKYDEGGRLVDLNYWWDSAASTTTYSSTDILECAYTYDPYLGLKSKADFADYGMSTSHEETYKYDSQLDYLTKANYDALGSGVDEVWDYDAGGNRASDSLNTGTWSYDNLDRMTASPYGSYSNDTLGNRTAGPSSTSMAWDCLNRMTSFTSGSSTWGYTYRADGMRVLKAGPSSTSTAYLYDGQTGMQDVDTTSAATTVTDYGLGARGIDFIAKTTSSGTVTAYPVYDGHGNMIATLGKSGSSFTVNDRRCYNPWGGVMSGSGTGDPKGRHGANLGHKQDDESAFTYMRARYYDALTGTFISEDTGRQGVNWHEYCANDPVNNFDFSGKDWDSLVDLLKNTLPEVLKGVYLSCAYLIFKAIATYGADFAGSLASYYGSAFVCSGEQDIIAGAEKLRESEGYGDLGAMQGLGACSLMVMGAGKIVLGMAMEQMSLFIEMLGDGIETLPGGG